jgi:putative tryptophan/tyrosine transport system substrate-binding protein
MRPHVVLDMAYEESGPRRTYGSNEHVEADGPTVFGQACKMGLEGIVSKRKNSAYRSGRSPDWLKSKNPACEALLRTGGRSRECGPPMRGEGTTRWVPDEAGHGPMRVLSFPSPSGRRDQMTFCIGRRDFITLLGGAATAWPLAARAQQPAMPVVAFINGRSPEDAARQGAAFRKGLAETGYVEGHNVAVEYHWLDGRYDRLPALVADLVRRRVAVIATPISTPAALAAKTATSTIPIVFGVGEDPVKLGLVTSLGRPGGNATGINSFVGEIVAKRLGLLHELVPKAVRIALLVNPANASTAEATLRDIPEAAGAFGLQIQIFKASTSREIEAAFATLAREPADALFIAPDGFFVSRRVQLALLAMRHGIPMAHSAREAVEAGALMSYGTDSADMFRQVGVMTGQVLKGAKPADLPVLQSTKFEFVINLQTARALGLDVPPTLLARADEVIE